MTPGDAPDGPRTRPYHRPPRARQQPGRISRPGRFSRAGLRGVGLALTAVVMLAGPAAAEPAVQVDRGSTRVGSTLVVRLSGWPVGTVSAEVCGNEARRGSVDCAVASAATVAVGPAGTAAVAVRVTRPPVGCPCVVRVRQVGGGGAHAVGVTIAGVPAGRPRPVPAPSLVVTRAGLDGPGLSWELVGGVATRTLTVTVRNPGPGAITEPQVVVAAGRPGRATSGATVYGTGSLAAGEERTLRLPVTFEAPSWGRYTVRADVRGADRAVVTYAHAHAYPWLWCPFVFAVAWFLRRRRAADTRWRRTAGTGARVVSPGTTPTTPTTSGPSAAR